VRTVRTECLDSILIYNPRHFHRVRTIYLHHNNTARPHRSLDLQTPLTVSIPRCKSRRVGDERSSVWTCWVVCFHEFRRAA
jgi:hypothetical protein